MEILKVGKPILCLTCVIRSRRFCWLRRLNGLALIFKLFFIISGSNINQNAGANALIMNTNENIFSQHTSEVLFANVDFHRVLGSVPV